METISIDITGGLVDFMHSYSIVYEFPYYNFVFYIRPHKNHEDGHAKDISNFPFKNLILINDKSELPSDAINPYESDYEPFMDRKVYNYLKNDRWGKFNTYFPILKKVLLHPIIPYSKKCNEICNIIKGNRFNLACFRLFYGSLGFPSFIENLDLIMDWFEKHDNILITCDNNVFYKFILDCFSDILKDKRVITLECIEFHNNHDPIKIAQFCNDIIFCRHSTYHRILSTFCNGEKILY